MIYLGDFAEDATVTFAFTTNAADGGRESFSATLEQDDIVILKDGAAMTLDALTITISNDLGSRVGVHVVSVDMSNDADFTTGSDYTAVLYASDETLDSQAPAGVLAHWSCQNRTVDVGRVSGSATAAANAEVVFDTDFATSYNATRNAWATNVQDTVGTGNLPADVIAVSGDTAAADNAELFFDGTGYNATNSTIGTCTTNTDMRGTENALLAASAPTNFGDLAITLTTGQVTVGTNADKTGYSISGTKTTLDALNDLSQADITGGAYSLDTDANGRIRIVDGIGAGELDTSGGLIAGIAGTIQTLDALDTAQDTQHGTTQSAITALNDLSTSDIDARLVAIGLDHLLSASVIGTDVADNSIFARLVSSSVTADWDEFNNTTDALQAIRDWIGNGSNLTESGGTGDQYTAIPWNSAWDAEVQSEVDDAIKALHLDHLIVASGTVDNSLSDATTTVFKTSLTGTDNAYKDHTLVFVSGALAGQGQPILSSVQTNGVITASEEFTAAPSNGVEFVITADHVHPISQIQDGLSTHSAADVWTSGTRTLTALGFTLDSDDTDSTYVNEIRNAVTGGAYALDTDANGRIRIVDGTAAGELDTASGTVIAASLGTQAKADVNAEVDTALADIHLDHLLAADYDPASKPGVSTALLNELIESDSGVSRFTANSLEQAPTGGSAPSAATIADAVWDELLSGHVISGSFGKALADTETDAAATLVDTGTTIPGLIAALNNLSQADIRTATGLASANLDTQFAALPTQAEITGGAYALDTDSNGRIRIVDGTGAGEIDTTSGAIATVNALGSAATAMVNAQVVDALATDTYAEPGQETPGATVSLAAKIGYVYKSIRNKRTQTSSAFSLYNDDGTTIGQTATVSDDGTTLTVAELTTGS